MIELSDHAGVDLHALLELGADAPLSTALSQTTRSITAVMAEARDYPRLPEITRSITAVMAEARVSPRESFQHSHWWRTGGRTSPGPPRLEASRESAEVS